MAVVILGLDETGLERYNGRPDLGWNHDREWGMTYAKKFPPYVYSANGMGALVHKVANVQLDWYAVGKRGEYLVRLHRPVARSHTVCGMCKFIDTPRHGAWTSTRRRRVPAKLCVMPDPNAVLCGKCHGEVATFSKPHGAGTVSGLTRKAAGERLGCVAEGRDENA